MKTYFSAVLFLAALSLNAQEIETQNQKWSAGRPDGHSPVSVMGDHMHGKDEWMFSYTNMHMNMEDLKQGNNDVSFDDALADYMVTPTKMTMNMQMLGVMYAPSNKITIMAMFNYVSMEMDHITRNGGTFTTESSGFGDIKIAGLYKFFNKNRQSLHGQIGFSIPTGSITESNVIPASAPNEAELPYPMQIGSGTFDSNLGLTYVWQSNIISGGSQLKGVFRLGKNNRDYSLGNRYSLNNWLAVKATDWLSFSARVEGITIGEIDGANPNLTPGMVITADTNNSGGNLINSGIGLNTYINNGTLKNLRFGFEFGFPLYQNLNGFQLKNKETLTFGLQYSFK